MDPETDRTFRTYAWSNYALHSGQRWSAVKCFAAASGLLAAGNILLIRAGASEWLTVPAGVLLVLAGIAFWLFDRRKQFLLGASGAALKMLDGQQTLPASADGTPNPLRIFEMHESGQKGGFFTAGVCDGKIFGFLYGLGILLGLYLSALPFFVKKPLFPESPAAVAPTPAGGFPGQAQRLRPAPSFPYRAPMTPPHRTNFAPITPYPRPPGLLPRPLTPHPIPGATPAPAPNPPGTP